jgi:hypothetical protein
MDQEATIRKNGSNDSTQRMETGDPIQDLKATCEEVANTAPSDVRKIASLHSKMILSYYQDVRRQAQQSFISALVAAIVGTFFFLYALWQMTSEGVHPPIPISLIAGTVIQVISAINFYLYARASRQFASFHICLERTNRFLLAHSMCENLICADRKDGTRVELIQLIANAPMLTMEMVSPGQRHRELRRNKPRAKQASQTIPSNSDQVGTNH